VTNDTSLNVVIVAYGVPELLDLCLATLGDELPVIVVDNSSNEKVSEVVGRHNGRYVDSGSNIGFAAGVNRALAELGSAHGDVLLLNPDARATGETVRALQQFMHTTGNERVACVSPALTRDDGRAERVEWPFPSPSRVWLEALGLGSRRPGGGFLNGAVLLLRADAIDDIGTFDERFFLYAEETDWQRRAANSGWSMRVYSEVVAGHTGAATSSDHAKREEVFHASAERYIRKWYGKAGWQAFRVGVLLGAGIRWAVTSQRTAQRDRFVRYLRGPVRLAEATDTRS
jgi:GT2 family glycosyltransferase